MKGVTIIQKYELEKMGFRFVEEFAKILLFKGNQKVATISRGENFSLELKVKGKEKEKNLCQITVKPFEECRFVLFHIENEAIMWGEILYL